MGIWFEVCTCICIPNQVSSKIRSTNPREQETVSFRPFHPPYSHYPYCSLPPDDLTLVKMRSIDSRNLQLVKPRFEIGKIEKISLCGRAFFWDPIIWGILVGSLHEYIFEPLGSKRTPLLVKPHPRFKFKLRAKKSGSDQSWKFNIINSFNIIQHRCHYFTIGAQ